MINLIKNNACILLLAFSLCVSTLCSAQEKEPPFIDQFNYSVSSEFGGSAVIYSLNFEKIISIRPGMAASVSIGAGLPFSDQSEADDPTTRSLHYLIPVQYNFLFGQKSSFLDVGITATFVHSRYEITEETSSGVLPSYRLGYRYQGNDGFLFKLAYTPIYFHESTCRSIFWLEFLRSWMNNGLHPLFLNEFVLIAPGPGFSRFSRNHHGMSM